MSSWLTEGTSVFIPKSSKKEIVGDVEFWGFGGFRAAPQ